VPSDQQPPDSATPDAQQAADIGQAFDRIEKLLASLVGALLPGFDPGTIELRASSGGAWLSLTLQLRVESRAQLESVYRAVAAHPSVRIVL
jgi:putative lipoic acid-binding regulatory protein